MRFFFDRCMPKRIARVVSAYEVAHTIRHHDDDSRFAETTADVDWIAALAKDDPTWVVVSGDGRILKNKVERSTLDEARLVFFCLNKAWLHTPMHEYAWKFIKIWPEIVESADASRFKIFEVGAGKALKVTPLA